MHRILAACIVGLTLIASPHATAAIDLTKAVVVTPPDLKNPESKSVQMLVEEVENRTGIRWEVTETWPKDAKGPVIAIGNPESPHQPPSDGGEQGKKAEGYRIRVAADAKTVHV